MEENKTSEISVDQISSMSKPKLQIGESKERDELMADIESIYEEIQISSSRFSSRGFEPAPLYETQKPAFIGKKAFKKKF